MNVRTKNFALLNFLQMNQNIFQHAYLNIENKNQYITYTKSYEKMCVNYNKVRNNIHNFI